MHRSPSKVNVEPLYPENDSEQKRDYHFSDIYPDLLHVIFSFLAKEDLIHVGQSSKQFRQIAEHDSHWKKFYEEELFLNVEKKQVKDGQWHENFMKNLETQYIMKISKNDTVKRLKLADKVTFWNRFLYRFICPWFFFVGLCLSLIAIHVVWDLLGTDVKVPTWVGIGLSAIPFLFCLLPSYFWITGCSFVEFPLSKRLIQNSRELIYEKMSVEKKEKQFKLETHERRIISIATIFIGILPLMLFCIYVKLLFSIPNWIAFLPFYIYCLFNTVYSHFVRFYFIKWKRERQREWILGFYISIFISLVSMYFAVQINLIALKLDFPDSFTVNWGVFLIPTWMFILFWTFLCLTCCCLVAPLEMCLGRVEFFVASTYMGCVGLVISQACCPFLIGVILYAVQLELNYVVVGFSLALIPVLCASCLLFSCCQIIFCNFNELDRRRIWFFRYFHPDNL